MNRAKTPGRWYLTALFVILTLVAAACGGDGESTTDPTDEPDTGTSEEASESADAGDGGDAVRLGILGECEGPFGGFHEDTVAGVTLALVNFAGASSNSTTSALDGWSDAVVAETPVELVGIGCGDDTPDTILGEVRE